MNLANTQLSTGATVSIQTTDDFLYNTYLYVVEGAPAVILHLEVSELQCYNAAHRLADQVAALFVVRVRLRVVR